MKKKLITLIPFLFTLCLLVLFYFKRYTPIKFYPPIVNFTFFLLFFSSLFMKETVIQKMARAMKPNLEEIELVYTKNLTYIWCVCLFLNFLLSVLTIFLSDKIWLLYNGFLSYFFIGTIFIVEYIVRIFFRKKHNL